MIKTLLFAALTLAVFSAGAQSVVIAEDLNSKEEDSDFGMNRKHYTHSFIGLQFVAGSPELPGAEVIYGRSRSLEYGYRYKRKFSETFSFGSEIMARRHGYHIKQTKEKLVPDSIIKDREKLVFLDAGLGVYKRINFGQRGNYIGRFIDAGAWGSWIFHSRHVYFYEDEGVSVRVRRSGVKYHSPFDYGLMVRVGFNNIVIKSTYRMSDLFKESANMPEFPRYGIGLEVGLHPY